jgi:radical SAM protein with 4Fe4S-binding SPASM domain
MKGFFRKAADQTNDGDNILNQVACTLLARLREPVSIVTIISDYLRSRGKESPEAFNQVYQFFLQLQERGIIDFVDFPADNSSRIFGFVDRYYPKIATFDLTDTCNLRCTHCYADATFANSTSMNWDALRPLLGGLQAGGLDIVQLTGGEPFLHPQFEEILEFGCTHFSSVYVLTNGTLITPSFVERFAEHSGKIRFGISLDGSTAEKHERIRGTPGCFDSTLVGVKRLRRAGLVVRIGMSFDDKSVDDILSTFELAVGELDANQFVYTPVLPYGRSTNCWHAADSAVYSQITSQIELLNESKYSDRLGKPNLGNSNPRNCGAGYRTYAFSSDGTVRPCVLFPKGFCRMGNVFKDDLDQVFSYENVKFFVETDISRGKQVCTDCEFNPKFCEGCLLNSLSSYFNRIGSCRWGEENKTTITEKCDGRYAFTFKPQ